jgi:formylglycine-generating enzyme required for sulfatase activity
MGAALIMPLVGLACDPPTEDAASPPPLASSARGEVEAKAASEPPSAVDAGPAPEAPPPPDGMVLVPPGIYLMGTPEGGSAEERPMHEVIVAALFADETEVTHGAYGRCVAAGACAAPLANNPYCNAHFDDHDDHPANCIRWDDARDYCAFAGKRLPTEREWEYLARGGAERRTFSWGEEPANPDIACYMHQGTCKVASFPPGAFGLYDVSGNVWEWTSSWYGPYPDELERGLYKVYRGGSWSRRFPKWLRNELRNRYRTSESSAALGVRCVQTKLPLECPADTEVRGDRCVRVRGEVSCEPGRRFDGKTCALDVAGALAGAAGSAPETVGATEPSTGGDEATPSGEPPTFTRTRTPQHDPDCRKNWPETPASYRWDGGTFHSRNPIIASAGCVKRDMGRDWTSACCRS